jgi:hypothetical protein
MKKLSFIIISVFLFFGCVKSPTGVSLQSQPDTATVSVKITSIYNATVTIIQSKVGDGLKYTCDSGVFDTVLSKNFQTDGNMYLWKVGEKPRADPPVTPKKYYIHILVPQPLQNFHNPTSAPIYKTCEFGKRLYYDGCRDSVISCDSFFVDSMRASNPGYQFFTCYELNKLFPRVAGWIYYHANDTIFSENFDKDYQISSVGDTMFTDNFRWQPELDFVYVNNNGDTLSSGKIK